MTTSSTKASPLKAKSKLETNDEVLPKVTRSSAKKNSAPAPTETENSTDSKMNAAEVVKKKKKESNKASQSIENKDKRFVIN